MKLPDTIEILGHTLNVDWSVSMDTNGLMIEMQYEQDDLNAIAIEILQEDE